MEQNRFSRQLIVLRAVIAGYTGHARLIHSDTGATLEVRVQAPAGGANLWAALVDKDDNGYRAQSLGALHADERGQAAGTFDVENPRVSPQVLAIVQVDDSDCRLAMSGFPDGPCAVNWADVRAAACEAVTSGSTPASGTLPEAEEDLFAGFGQAEDDPFSARGTTAAEAAGVSPDAVWCEEIAALQEAFASRPAVQTFPGTRYTFILMPATDDAPEYYAGLVCEHGVPVRACYAVRGEDRHTPPPGLETFVWRDGFWATYIDADTGDTVTDE